MAGSVVTVEVDDPHQITPTMWKWFTPTETSAITPKQFRARTYRAGDWRKYRIEKDAYHTSVSVGKIGHICFVRMEDREATDMVITAPGLDHYCLTFLQWGGGELVQPGPREEIPMRAAAGAVFRGEPRTVMRTDRQNTRLNVWIPAALVHNEARLLFEKMPSGEPDLSAAIDATRGAGASLARMTWALFEELAHPDSPFAGGPVTAPAQEMFLQLLATAATQTQCFRARESSKAAAPRIVRQAEEFIHANAEVALTVAAIADAAGCGVRALRLAFRRFRGTSPMLVLRNVRLEQAHRLMAASDGSQTVTDIAARFGFLNGGRFASAYWRRFGRYPSDAIRRGHGATPDRRGETLRLAFDPRRTIRGDRERAPRQNDFAWRPPIRFVDRPPFRATLNLDR